MKRFLLIAVSLLGLAALGLAAQNRGPVPLRDAREMPFGNGERLKFAVSYDWHAVRTDVASAVLSVDTLRFGGIPSYKISMTCKTARFFDVFFKMRELFTSTVAIDGFRPLQFLRDTHEGEYFAYNLYKYDWDRNVIKADLDSKSHGKSSIEIPIEGECMYDLPSLIYMIRNMDVDALEKGAVYHVAFAIDDDVYQIALPFRGRENRKVAGLGTVPCLKFGVAVLTGSLFSGDEDANIYFTDDENRLPVYFYVPLKVGAMGGRLVSSQGLKN